MKKKLNPWMKHVASVRKLHPKKKLSECLKLAKKSYKGGKK